MCRQLGDPAASMEVTWHESAVRAGKQFWHRGTAVQAMRTTKGAWAATHAPEQTQEGCTPLHQVPRRAAQCIKALVIRDDVLLLVLLAWMMHTRA